MGDEDPFAGFGQGLGELFGGLLGGVTQGLGNAMGNNPDMAKMFGVSEDDVANMAAAGQDAGGMNKLFSDALMKGAGLDKSKEPGTVPFATAMKERRIKIHFTNQETLSPDKFNRGKVDLHGCYSSDSWDYEKLPVVIEKIDFHGDGYFTDYFVHLLSTNTRLSFTSVQLVDLRGCSNLTDIGVTWLSSLLRSSPNLHTVLLGGCPHVTEQGVTSFQQLASDVTLSLAGTSVTALPAKLWKDGTQLQGCPLLHERNNDDLKPVPMQKLAVHLEQDATCSFAALLATKQKEAPVPLKYLPSWTCGESDFSITETLPEQMANGLLRPVEAQQVIIPVNVDTSPESAVRHIMNTVQYHVDHSDKILQYRNSFGRIIRPWILMNTVWDAVDGRLMFRDAAPDKDPYDSDDDDEQCFAVLDMSVTKTRPYIKFEVECKEGQIFNTSFGLIGKDGGEVLVKPVKLRNGDVITFGIKHPEKMKYETILDGEDHTLFWSRNEQLDDTPSGVYFTYHHEHQVGQQMAEGLMELEEHQDMMIVDKAIPSVHDLNEVETGRKALQSCCLVLVLISKEFAESEEYMDKVHTAMQLGKKVVYLDVPSEESSMNWDDFPFKKEDLHVIVPDDSDEGSNKIEKLIVDSFMVNNMVRTGSGAYMTHHHQHEFGEMMAAGVMEKLDGPAFIDKAIASLDDRGDMEMGMAALQACSVVLVFLSKQFAESEEYMDKVRLAMKLEKKVIFIHLSEEEDPVEWDDFEFKKEDHQVIDLSEEDADEELIKAVSSSVSVNSKDDLDETWSHGSFQFAILGKTAGAVRFMDYMPITASGTDSKRDALELFVHDETANIKDAVITDYTSGVHRTQSRTVLLTALQYISSTNSKLSVKVTWPSDSTKSSRQVGIGIATTPDMEDHPDLTDDPGVEHIRVFNLEKSGQDVITIEVGNVHSFMVPNQKYPVKFYQNNELIVQIQFIPKSTDMVPKFLVAVDTESELHVQDYSPPQWFTARMQREAQVPGEYFIVPGRVGDSVEVTNTTVKFDENPKWNYNKSNSFSALTPLTQHNPGFKVVLLSDTESEFYIGAPTVGLETELHTDEHGLRRENGKEGDVIICMLNTKGCKFDKFGIPLRDQKLTITYTVNDEEVQVDEVHYLGGGLFPSVAGNSVLLHLTHMDLAKHTAFTKKAQYPQKNFVVVATTKDSNLTADSESMVSKLEFKVSGLLTSNQEELKVLRDATRDKVPTSFCGDLVKRRMEVQNMNREHLAAASRSVLTFMAMNTETMEGYDDLCKVLSENHNRLMFEEGHLYNHSSTVRAAINKIMKAARNHKIISRDDYRGRWGLSERQLTGVLRLLHGWGKVLFLPALTPWVVILDIEWFLGVLRQLDKAPENMANGKLRSLHPNTPVFEDHQLAKDQPPNKRKMLLEVILRSHQLLCLTGFRTRPDDTQTYLVNPRHIKNPSVPLSNFYDPDDPSSDIFTVTLTFSLPAGVDLAVCHAVLCEVAKVSPPIVVAPTFLVQQVGASQVVLTWSSPKSDTEEVEVRLAVSTFLPMEEVASQGIVTEYTYTVMHCYQDVISHALLSAKTPFVTSCDPQRTSGNMSICSSHRWHTSSGEDLCVSVCSLCTNCSDRGIQCKYNHIRGPYDTLHCQCETQVVCCQDCGLCQPCAQQLWSIRSSLRPCTMSADQLVSRSLCGGKMVFTNAFMTPGIFNQATLIKTRNSDASKHVNFGLLSEDGERYIQLFPGKALVGMREHSYHRQTRQALTFSHVKDNATLDFNFGDRVTIQMSEPHGQSLDHPQRSTSQGDQSNNFSVSILHKANCSLSRTTNTVRGRSETELGMLVSQRPLSTGCLYFDVEIVGLSSGGRLAGVGLAMNIEVGECIGHGTGHSLTEGCKAWANEWWHIGDIIGCGSWRTGNYQDVVFTHNDKVVCRHTLRENCTLHPAVLVRTGEAVTILHNDPWKNPTDLQTRTEATFPANQEFFESDTKEIRISPKSTLLFEQGVNDSKGPVASMYIENNSKRYVLWKVRTNVPEYYISNPNRGIIRPGEMSEIINECKSADRPMEDDRFQIMYCELRSDDLGSGSINREKATELWNNEKRKAFTHVVQCQWKTDQDQAQQQETTFAEELDDATFDMVEPSYQVTVLKNDSPISSYWVPKANYRFAMDTTRHDAESALHEDIILHAPKLPVKDLHDGFRVGMTVNVEVDKSLLSESFEEAITSVCAKPSSIFAVCQIDKVEYGTPDKLHLSFHGSPGKDQSGKRFSLTVSADSPTLHPVKAKLSSSEEVSVSVEEGDVVQLLGFSPNTCRAAPRHLFQETQGKSEPYSGRPCENLLFGAHRIHLARDQLTPKYLPPRPGPTYMFLPAKLSADMLRHPSLQQLHNFSKMQLYPVCQVNEQGYSQDWHLIDREAYVPDGFIPYSLIYRNLPVMNNYIDLASKPVRLPSHSKMVKDCEAMPRNQVESLLMSMLQTYALTAQLLSIPRFMKVSLVDTEMGRTWEPSSFLPLDCTDEAMCSTHIERNKQVTGSYTELARHCCIHYGQDDTDQGSSHDTPDCFNVTTKDVPEVLTKMPWLKTLVIKGRESLPDIHLSLPELTSVVNTSPCNVIIDDCPKLTTWEGPMTSNVEAQLELLTRCPKLEKLVIHENCIKKLPAGIGKLKQLKTLHLPRCHLTELPHSFTALKNLTDLRIMGPVAHWNRKTELTITKEEIWRQFPFISEQDLDAALKTHSWDGDTLRCRTSDQHGKLLSAFYVLSPKFGHKEAGCIYGGFPREILQLTGLRHLHMAYQGIHAIPPQISRLVNLHTLELDGCLDLETLPSTLGFLNLKRLSLQGCLSLRTPSREIVERGTEAVSAYLKQMARGKSQNWRTKLMLVGIGGAGKTTLLRALKSSSHTAKPTAEEEITHGIDIDTWTAADEKNHPGKKVTFNAWDFAGQTVFYNTHQFFMSDRAVYLLVWSCRQGFDNSGLEFWLSSIQCHSPDTPVFVIATHADRLTTDLPKGQLQEVYPQIKGFHYVGSTTGKGIPELKEAILTAALELDYMGEDVPTVYLDLEQKLLSLRDEENPYIEWSVVRQYAMEAGIFDDKDVARAVQFLQHIGSVQYFDYALLRDYVVINPQWIVGAMASVVTFKDSVIKNGRLYHKHVGQLWKQYPVKLHEWLLRLTEMFDLTFQINKDLSLVPCLLSNEQPEQAKWPPRDELKDSAMMLIVYTFRYLPTGLFNRLQARLFEFSNGKTVWKKGSILEKKGHYAYIKHERDQRLSVQVLGRHPENILFLIHETLEDLINLSYRGIQFEYLIPCPDCVKELGMDNPAMFRASLVREAAKCSAPYLQCRRLFHTVPMAMAKALMPPNDNQELDLQLQRSMQSLGEMRSSLQTDVFMLFSANDLLTEAQGKKLVDPRRVYNNLKDKFSCYFDEHMDQANVQSLMVSMQEAKTLLVFISNNFVQDTRCSQLLQYAHSAFQDRLCLINLSADYSWKNHTAGFILSQMVFVNMKMFDEENYKKQLQQLEEMLQEKLGLANNKTSDSQQDPVCFISYAWANSKAANASRKLVKKEATVLDPRSFKERIEKEIRVPCWLDVEQTGKRGLFEDITEGLRAADLMVAFVSNEYLNSTNCMMELRFAVSTLKIPVIFVAVGIGMEWQYEEVGTLMRNAKSPLVDMRNEITDTNVKIVMDFIQKHILSPEQREEKMKKIKSVINKTSIVELANISYHEEFELAQRKLMRRLSHVASYQSVIPYPRIFIVDFADTDKLAADKKSTTTKRPESAVKTLARRRSMLQRKASVLNMETPKEENKLSLDDPLCVRYLCEHAEGWHSTTTPLELRGLTVTHKEALLERIAPYLARTLTILKHSSVPLNCMKGEEGTAFKEFLVKLALEAHDESKDAFEKAYVELLQYVIDQDKDMTKGDLKLCVLSGGRIRWLCAEHQKGYRVTVLNTDVSQRVSSQKEDTDFLKGITDGLKEVWEKFSSYRAGASMHHTGGEQINIAEVLNDAFLDFTPKMESLKKLGGKIFKTVKQHYEKEKEAAKKEEDPKATPQSRPVPKPRKGSATPRPASGTVPSGSNTARSDEAAPKPDKRKAFKQKKQTSVEQRQAAQMMMQQQLQQQMQQQMQQQLMGGDGNTSQACVIL